MQYKIVFFDIDGTLTNHEDGSISTSTKKVIRTLINNGIRVVAATGRPLSLCTEFIELGIETLITANGGYVKHNQQIIHKVPMNKDFVNEVIEFANTKKQHSLILH